MTFETITQYLNRTGESGVSGIFTYATELRQVDSSGAITISNTSYFIPLTLFAFFLVSFMGLIILQAKLRGKVDFVAVFTASSFVTLIIAFLMSLVENLINPLTLITCFVISLIGVAWLVTSRDKVV